MVTRKAPQGRPRTIPQSLFVRVFSLKRQGLGYQRIAKELDALNIATSRGSVYRLIKRLKPYDDFILENEDEIGLHEAD